MVLSKLLGGGRAVVGIAGVVLHKGAVCLNTVRKALGSGSGMSLQAAFLLFNVYFFAAGIKARKRAEFAAAVKCITDLDERGLRLVLGYIPAWVKFNDYERASFLNESLKLLWPAFDRAICNLLKAELEPLLQANSPAAVAGCYFDSLSFGSSPIQIVGIKNSTFRTGSDQLGIVLDIDVRWAGTPDVTLKLVPSRKWVLKQVKIGKLKLLPQVDFTPEMHVALNTLHVAGMLRVTLTPIIQDVPFVGGISLSWLEMPMIDFDVKGLGGADVMSMPAVADWIMTALVQGYLQEMVWPKQVTIPFIQPEELEQWQAPLGVVTVEVLEARLPPRLSTISRKEKPLHPYAAVLVGKAGTAVAEEKGPNVQSATTSTQWNTTEPTWREKFHLCVYDPAQVLKVVLAHNVEGGAQQYDLTLGRVDVPLSALVEPVRHARQHRLSGHLLAATQARRGFLRGRLKGGTQRPHTVPASRASSIAGDSASGGEEAGRQLPAGHSDDGASDASGASPRAAAGSSYGAGNGASPSGWSFIGGTSDGGAGAAAAAAAQSDEVEEVLSFMSPQHAHSQDQEGGDEMQQARMLLRPPSPVRPPPSGAGLLGVLDFRSFAASGAEAKPQRSAAKPPLKPTKHAMKQHARNQVAHEAALAAAGPDGAWLPLLSMKNASGALECWDASETSMYRPEQRHRSAFFPSMTHISTLLGGQIKAPSAAGSPPTDTAHASSHQAAAAAPPAEEPDTPRSEMTDATAPDDKAAAAPGDAAAVSPGSHFFSSSFWDWHQATARKGPPNKVANRIVGWWSPSAAGHADASSAAQPLARSGAKSKDPQARDRASASSQTTPREAADRAAGSGTAASSPAASDAGGSGKSTERPRGSRKSTDSLAAGNGKLPPGAAAAGGNGATTSAAASRRGDITPAGSEISVEDQAQIVSFAEALDSGHQARAASKGGEVLGLARVRISFRAIVAEPTCDVMQSHPAYQVPGDAGGSGKQVGVLLVQLRSAALLKSDLEHPAVRMSIGKQVRQTLQYSSLHGGRVTWDSSSFAFAIAVDPAACADEMTVQVGEVPESFGDRLWATWFSSAAQYARDAQPLAICNIPLKDAVRRGRLSGTWEMVADTRAGTAPSGSESAESAGQITLRFSWRPTLPA